MARASQDPNFDPGDLQPQDLIRYTERLIRAHHRVLDDDWQFWGYLADHLNFIAHVPDKIRQRESDWHEFHRAQAMCLGYIRMTQGET